MQKSRQIAKKKEDKGKETRRFDKFVITGRFAFDNQEIQTKTKRLPAKLGDLEGLGVCS